MDFVVNMKWDIAVSVNKICPIFSYIVINLFRFIVILLLPANKTNWNLREYLFPLSVIYGLSLSKWGVSFLFFDLYVYL